MDVILSNVILNKIQKTQDRFIIFGLISCPYTLISKQSVKENKLKYKFYPIDKYRKIFHESLYKLDETNKYLELNLNHRTFPIIFYNNKFIGGSSDLINYIQNSNTNTKIM
jgi:glutaredoxin